MRNKHFENRLTNKDLIPKLILNRDFALARGIIHDHKLSILATFLTRIKSFISGKSFVTFDAELEQLG